MERYSPFQQENNAINYLDQKLEANVTDEQERKMWAAVERLQWPLAQIEYSDSGSVEIYEKPFRISIEYDRFPDLPYDWRGTSMFDSTIGEINALDWRELKRFTLTREDRGHATIDAMALIPPEHKVVFNTRSNEQNAGSDHLTEGAYYPQANVIAVFGSLLSPGGIMTLLHEIGHAVDRSSLSPEERDMYDKGSFKRIEHGNISRAVTLQQERNAEAFMLRHFRHFTDKELSVDQLSIKRDDVKLAVRAALQSYSRRIRERRSHEHAIVGNPGDWSEYEEDFTRYYDDLEEILDDSSKTNENET